ncbi:hypothetical protein Ahy_B05g076314 [Arachis hypogaea]|uniref:Uncharacterized protein n=1 Tax=Arachis hypogaea TaxID=3818 RepID=A0A444Z316_ARAHY|nr:hypothetical protein Ahy_B05g076314 [Arachis hypogaea]
MQCAGNIVVHRFDRRKEVFEVHKMPTGRLILHDKNAIVGIFKWSNFHVAILLRVVLTSTSIGRCMSVMCTRCRRFARSTEFMGDTTTWPDYPGLTMIANPALRRMSKGRPKSTRYLNEMDSRKICVVHGR